MVIINLAGRCFDFAKTMRQGSGDHHADSIQKHQDRSLRTIEFKTRHEKVNHLHISNHILKITNDIKLQNCLLTYQYLNDKLPARLINNHTVCPLASLHHHRS